MAKIVKTPIRSTNVKELNYNSDTKTLEVNFHNGSIYRYGDVSPQDFQKLHSAKSVGATFHKMFGGKKHFRVI